MSKEKQITPPYVPYRTFRNFIDGLKPVPPVIDRGVLQSMGGALQTQLLASLKYLKLIDENSNKTRDELRDLATLQGAERATKLKQILEKSYPYLFPVDKSFNLAEGTGQQLTGLFQQQGASGDTVRKCGKFFLDAAKDAGIQISKYISPTKSNRNSSVIKSRKSSRKKDIIPEPKNLQSETQKNEWVSVFKNAFDLLPEYTEKPKPHWTNGEKGNFLNLVTAIVTAFIDTDEKRR